MKCPACNHDLQPDALNPKRLFCTICADYFDLKGNPVDRPKVTRRDAASKTETPMEPPPERLEQTYQMSEVANPDVFTLRTVTITVGELSMQSTLPFSMKLAGQTITIA